MSLFRVRLRHKVLFRGDQEEIYDVCWANFFQPYIVQILLIKTTLGFEFGSGSRLDTDSAKAGSDFSKAWIRIQQNLNQDSAKPGSGSDEPGLKTLFKREGGPSTSRTITFHSGRREERIVDGEKEGEQGLPGLSFHHLTRWLDEKNFFCLKIIRDIPSIRVTSSVIYNFVRAKRTLLGLFV
jgi:hypothetical protein